MLLLIWRKRSPSYISWFLSLCALFSAAALCKPPLTPLLDAAQCESSICSAMWANSASVAHHGVALLCSCAAARALEPPAMTRLLLTALKANGGDALKGYYSHMLVLPLVGLPGVLFARHVQVSCCKAVIV
jgi:hypothetical protein